MEALETAQEVITRFSAFSYVGIYFLALVANVLPVAPEEVVLLLSGYMLGTDKLPLQFFWVCAITITGFFTSDLFLFWLARRGSKILDKMKRKVLGDNFFEQGDTIRRRMPYIIVLSRFVMYFRWLGPVIAGSFKTSLRRFVFFDLLALVIYVPLMVWLGKYFHGRIENVVNGVNVVGNIVVFVVVIGVIAIVIRWFKRRLLNRYVYQKHMNKVKSFFGFTKVKKKSEE